MSRSLALDPGPAVSRRLLIIAGLLAALGVGAVAAFGVYWDGLWSHRVQVETLGPFPSTVNDLPYVTTVKVWLVVLSGIGLVSWILLRGEWDRPLTGLLAFAFFSAALPGTYQGTLFLIGLLLIARGTRRGDIPIVFTPLVFPLGFILISYSTTFIFSGKLTSVLPNMGFRASYMALILILPMLIRTRRQRELLFHYLIISAVIGATAGIAQFFLSLGFGRPISFAVSNAAKASTPLGQFARVTGFMSHPNHAAQAFSSMAVLLAYFATRPRDLIKPQTRTLYLAAAAYLSLGVFFTISRSGWLSLGVCLMLVPFVRWPRYSPYLLIVAGTVLAIGVQTGALQYLYRTIYEFNAASAGFREKEDAIALMGFLDSPIIGQGVQGSPKFYNPFNLQVHNTYLQILAEMGLVGAAAFGTLLVMLVTRWLERFFNATNRIDRDWLIGLIICLGITLIQGKFTLFLWIRYTWFLLAMIETCVLISRNQPDEFEPDDIIFLPPPPWVPLRPRSQPVRA